MGVLKGMPLGLVPLAVRGHSKLTAVWIVLASPLTEGNPTVSPGAMTARDFCPAPPMDEGTHPIDAEVPVFEQVKKFPGLSPASNETVGGAAAWATPAVPHPTSILNIANKSCRIFIKPSFRVLPCVNKCC